MIRSDAVAALPRWGFASPGRVRDALTRLALAGVKTATAGLLAEYRLDGDPVPTAGDRQVLIDSAGHPIAVVETTGARVVPLSDIDDAHAVDEGEGYANAAEFRAAHERFWNGYLDVLRRRINDPSFAISDGTPVVAERFRVVEILGSTDGRPSTDGPPTIVRPAMPADRRSVDGFLAERGADVVARRGELVDTRHQPALLAEQDGALAGVATWIASGESVEILTLDAAHRWQGAGTGLIAAARTVAQAIGARRLWLITTNDNLEALRFYQRRGLRLARIHAGAVDHSRSTLKPSIPEIGAFGIPLRDELELEMEIPAR